MEPIIQPSSPLVMMKVEFEPAANPPQPEQSFNEVLLKHCAVSEKSRGPKEETKSQPAANPPQRGQATNERPLKQHGLVEKDTDSKEKTESQPVVNPPQPEPSTNEVVLKQNAIVENSTDPKERIPEETIPLNLLPIIPTPLSQNEGNSLDPMKADPLGQVSSQEESINQNQGLPLILSLLGGVGNLEKNTPSATPGQVKGVPPTPESFVVQDLRNILNSKEGLLQVSLLPQNGQIPVNECNPQDPRDLNQAEGAVDPKNIRWVGNSSFLDNQLQFSADKLPVQSPFDDRTIQPGGTSLKSELNPNLLNQKEAVIAQAELGSQGFFEDDANFSSIKNVPKVISGSKDQPAPDSQLTPGLAGERNKPIQLEEKGFYQELQPVQKEALGFYQRMEGKVVGSTGNSAETRDAPPKEGSNVAFLGRNSTIPSLDTNSPTFWGIDEKLSILLGQDSTKEEITGRSWNGESSGLGNSPAEKKSSNSISGGENHPTQDPLGLNDLLGSPKPSMLVEEAGIHQKPQLSKTENFNLSQQIAEKVFWSIKNNEEKIHLTLDPPQLGNLFIELHRDREEIKATLWADNPKTKEILENNQFQLQKTLEADGFKLEKYEVFVQKDMGSFQGNEESSVFHGQQSRKQSMGIQESELPQPLEILPGLIRAAEGSRYIDRLI
jgi:hypothetical protein